MRKNLVLLIWNPDNGREKGSPIALWGIAKGKALSVCRPGREVAGVWEAGVEGRVVVFGEGLSFVIAE
jgi:hypothetical protein